MISSLVGTLLFGLLFAAIREGVRRVYPEAWQRRWVRRALWALPALWAGGMLLGFAAARAGAPSWAHVFIAAAAAVVVLLVCVLPPLFLAAGARAWLARAERTPPPVSAPPSSDAPVSLPVAASTRRALLLRATTALPATGVLAAAAGARDGFGAAHLNRIELAFPNLPPELDGFSLLHYTDLHLGTFVDLGEVERVIELGRGAGAELVVLTGDMSDDLDGLGAMLRRFESLAPRHGVFASLGNHEYFRGIRPTVSAYAKSGVELLRESGTTLRVGGAPLYLAGADDPRVLRGDKKAFLERTVNEALASAPSDGFKLLLSHRPEGFVPAARAGFDLTLSGHTHGAQLGLGGRSLLEGLMPDRFLWGAYQAGERRLYTSSGAGHWFPFRLGCPREVALIVLRRGPADTAPKKTRIA